ncbi:hypothetical protein ABT237_35315 [Streptomyces sp. NPDC001581]|uniref:hypothetical protein n=1 Tax=Streptomyces sp. NPDC001581 TaxID=3154386 RepID=UPI003317918D
MGERGELCRVESVAAGFLVPGPDPGTVLAAIGQPPNDSPPRQAALPRHVLLQGLQTRLEGFSARARPGP